MIDLRGQFDSAPTMDGWCAPDLRYIDVGPLGESTVIYFLHGVDRWWWTGCVIPPYIYIYIHTCIHIYIYVEILFHIRIHVYTDVHLQSYVCVYIYRHLSIFYLCTNIFVYIYMLDIYMWRFWTGNYDETTPLNCPSPPRLWETPELDFGHRQSPKRQK